MKEGSRWERHLRGVASLSEVAFELQWDGENLKSFHIQHELPLSLMKEASSVRMQMYSSLAVDNLFLSSVGVGIDYRDSCHLIF
jgi:hypothetical protein